MAPSSLVDRYKWAMRDTVWSGRQIPEGIA